MKTHRYLFVLLAFCLAAIVPRTARADDEVSFDYFYDNLKPYGEWVEIDGYGRCWHPSDVAEDWAPYTDGYWAYTDAGWTWVSYEDFGGIVYHYGRWVRVTDEGWCWVPDNDWGPAWVSWRDNDEYVGWAPLPPEAHFRPEVGISVWVDDTYDIGPSYYRFCHLRDFGAPVIREVCLPPLDNVTIIRETVNITNITINTGYGGPFCGGPRYDFVALHVGRPIPALKLVRETNITNIYNVNVLRGGRRSINSLQRGNTLVMPGPRIRPIADLQATLPNVRPARVLAANRVDRGWGSVTAPQERDQIRQELRQQAKGATPENSHAKPFKLEDVKAVPVKADLKAVSPVATGRDHRPGKGAAGIDTPVAGSGGTLPPGSVSKGGKPGADAAVVVEGEKRKPGEDRHPGTARGPSVENGPTADTPPDNQLGKNAARGAANPGVVKPFSTVPRVEKPVVTAPGAVDPDIHKPGDVRHRGPGEKGDETAGAPNGPGAVAPVPASTPRILTAPRSSNQTPRRGGIDDGTDRNPPPSPNLTPKRGAGAGIPGAKIDSEAQDAAVRRERAEALREQNAAREQSAARQQAAAENRERAAAAVENRERATAAAAQARERTNAAAENRERAASAAAAQSQERAAEAAAMRERAAASAAARERSSAARERAVEVPHAQPPQMQHPAAPVPTPSAQDPRARGKKDKKDDER